MSGGASVGGYFSYLVPGGFLRGLNPALVAVACDLYADERMEGVLVDTFVTMAHDGAIDFSGDNEDQRSCRLSEPSLDLRCVEQAKCDVQCLTEASVGIVVDFSCVNDDAYPQLPLSSAGPRKARVVIGKKPTEGGDGAIQQKRFGRLVHWADECQDTITAVDKPVAIAFVDSRRAQRRVKYLVGLVPELGLNGVGAGGGTLDIQRNDGPVMGQAGCQGWFH